MEESLGLQAIFNIVLRRKWHFFISFLTVVSLSAIFTFMLPKIYQSAATILIEKRGRDAVKGIFEPAKISTSKFQTMQTVIKSRAKIEELIKKLSLDKNIRGPLGHESLIGKIKDALSIELRSPNLFTITYRGRDPHTCMQVVNAVAGFFVEQDINALYGPDYASFPMLNELLAYYEKRVNKAQGVLTKFKIENKGQMPGSLDENFAELEKHQIQLANLELAIKETSAKQEEIKKRLLGEITEPLPGGMEQEAQLSPDEKALKELNQKLENLLTSYTEKHPSVVKLKSQIETLKARLLASYNLEGLTQDKEDAVNVQKGLLNPRYLKLRKLSQQTKERLASLREERERVKRQITVYDEKVKNVPLKEQEYAALQRELNVNKNIYDSLLAKLEKTRLAKEVDLMEKNIRFTVINAAPLPLNPVSPKMSKNLLVGTILGLFLGICSTFWAEYTDHSLRDPKEVQKTLQVPMLATIPTVYTDVESVKRRRMAALSFLGGGIYMAFLLLLIVRELVMTYTPSLLYLQTYKNFIKQFLSAVGIGLG